MMRQVIFNPNAFSYPVAGFYLGLTSFTLFVIVEIINITAILRLSNIDDVVTKIVSYSVLLNLPQIFLRQKKKFSVKYDVDDFFLTIV